MRHWINERVSMKKFYLITNYEKDSNLDITNKIIRYIENNGGSATYQTIFSKERNRVDESIIPEDTQCILVLGGDGTLIKAARELVSRNIPLIGVNFGHLGYLVEIEISDIEHTLDLLMNDKYQLERRMMITADVSRNGNVIHKGVALNDISVSRNGKLKVLNFKVYVNGQFINKYSADGIIVSTPTGSTAYNLSAGGPIVEPCADIIVLTPVCPHTLNSRSIVLSAESVIDIEILSDRTENEDFKNVNYDGSDICELMTDDVITIRKSDMYTNIAKLSKLSFFETLQKKMSNI